MEQKIVGEEIAVEESKKVVKKQSDWQKEEKLKTNAVTE